MYIPLRQKKVDKVSILKRGHQEGICGKLRNMSDEITLTKVLSVSSLTIRYIKKQSSKEAIKDINLPARKDFPRTDIKPADTKGYRGG